MKTWLTERLAASARRAYPLILHAYPPAFRRDFGQSMGQVFGDLTRDVCRRSGLLGLVMLWVRTVKDTIASLILIYARERPASPPKLAFSSGVAYATVLALSIGYGAVRFREFYAAPSFSSFGVSEAVDEDVLIARYGEALAGDFGDYKTYVFGVSLLLAALLGVAAGLFGIAQRSAAHGAAALAIGAAFTVGVVSLLPTIWFPLDRYPVGFVWILRAAPVCAGVWAAVHVCARFAGQRRPV